MTKTICPLIFDLVGIKICSGHWIINPVLGLQKHLQPSRREHLNLKDKNVNIMLFGVRGMHWEKFNALFVSKLKSSPPPNYLLVHQGSTISGFNQALDLFTKSSALSCVVRFWPPM